VDVRTNEVDELFTSDFVANPYPAYAVLRESGPVHRITLPGGIKAWLVTRYAEARNIFQDNGRFSKNMADGWPAFQRGEVPLTGDVVIGLGDSMLVSDPPRHTRLRALVSKVFTARRVDLLVPRVARTGAELLARMRSGRSGTADLVADFARLLPMSVICELIGVPQEDSELLRVPVETVMSNDGASQQGAMAAFEAVHGYLAALVERKRGHGADDLTSALIEVQDDGDKLSADELVAMLALLVSAGHETTVNLIANGALALLRHPEQLAHVRAHDTWADAVEEVLRWDGSIQNAIWRFTRTEVEIGGVVIPAGEPVAISVAAADRDESRFPDGENLDVLRVPRSHLAFGHGIHHCLGAALARMETRTTLPMIFEQLPGIRIAGDPVYRPSTVSRAMSSLPVAFDTTGSA
jgi:cytochrome P450